MKRPEMITLPANSTITPIFGSDLFSNFYELETIAITDEQAYAICKILEIDPDKTNAILIDSGSIFPSPMQAIVRRIKEANNDISTAP